MLAYEVADTCFERVDLVNESRIQRRQLREQGNENAHDLVRWIRVHENGQHFRCHAALTDPLLDNANSDGDVEKLGAGSNELHTRLLFADTGSDNTDVVFDDAWGLDGRCHRESLRDLALLMFPA